ncbi:MAG: 5-formyltetrahydrofolate cyclo-ligase [Coriobacteriales bacterium]|jgi:5-formyltetrahydrofolate cyclo-ligase|nr:5-formyltetrahydrofolate cyclo-ligase [Coriobacteriales bacterium]
MDKAGTKQMLRDTLLARRDGLPPAERRRLSGRIVARLTGDVRVRDATTVLSYQPFGSEVDVGAFNDWAVLHGKTLAFPFCHGAGIMEALVPSSIDALVKGRYGIVAPDPERSRTIIPEALDLILVPCVGFDEGLVRLGMGGGFYDRYLLQCTKAVKLGVAFLSQKVPKVAREPWDAVLDEVVCA